MTTHVAVNIPKLPLLSAQAECILTVQWIVNSNNDQGLWVIPPSSIPSYPRQERVSAISGQCAGTGAGWMRRNGIGSTFWGSFHQFLCVWAAPGPGRAAEHKPEINLKPDICVWAELQLSHCCHQQLCDKCETQQRFSIFSTSKKWGIRRNASPQNWHCSVSMIYFPNRG